MATVSRIFFLALHAPVPAAGPARRRMGFTLIELLVAMALGLLLVLFLFQLFNATVVAWRAGENQNETYREARAAMQMMVRDISQTAAAFPINAYPSPTPTPLPTPTPSSPSPTPGIAPVLVLDHYPGAIPAPPTGANDINEELYCLTNIPNNGASGLCAVGYFCAWMPDLVPDSDPKATQKRASAPHAYALVRQFLGSGRPAVAASQGNTGSAAIPGLFERIQKATNAAVYKNNFSFSFNDLYERAPPPLVPDPSSMKAAATELCSYIWDLQFRTPTTLLPTTPNLPATLYGATPRYPSTAVYPPGTYTAILPPYIEIRFKALSAGAARQLEGNGNVSSTTWSDTHIADSVYQRIILPGTRQFVTRVPIGSGSSTSTP